MSATNLPPITTRLREIINTSGLSVHQIAMKADVSAGVIYRFMNGSRSPTFDTVAKIASVLRVRLVAPTIARGKPSESMSGQSPHSA